MYSKGRDGHRRRLSLGFERGAKCVATKKMSSRIGILQRRSMMQLLHDWEQAAWLCCQVVLLYEVRKGASKIWDPLSTSTPAQDNY